MCVLRETGDHAAESALYLFLMPKSAKLAEEDNPPAMEGTMLLLAATMTDSEAARLVMDSIGLPCRVLIQR